MTTKAFFADLHVHSMYSPSCLFKGYACRSTITDILKTAKKKGLRGIAIADHNVIEGSLKAVKLAKRFGIVAIPAMEVHSRQGHILAYNIKDQVKKGMDFRETIEKIHDLGGLAVCAHPFLFFFGTGQKRIKYFDGVECYNARQGIKVPMQYVSKKQFITAGTDAHTLREIGNAVTMLSCDFRNPDEFTELLRRRKTSYEVLGRTSKITDVVLPQIKNIFDYHLALLLNRVKKPV